MKKLGLILNPSAKINKKYAANIVERFEDIFGASALVTSTNGMSDIPDVLKEYHDAGVRILLISGGDGTICEVLTSYINEFGEDELPTVVPLMGGTINMIGADAGLRKDQFQVSRKLYEIMSQQKPIPITRRGLIRVSDRRLSEPNYGFSWIDSLLYRILLDYYSQGAGVQVASMMTLRMILNSLSNADDSEFRDIDSTVYIDGAKLAYDNHLLMIASSLKKFVFGFDIFNEQCGPGKTFNIVYMRAEYLKKERLKIPLGLYRSIKSDPSGNFINQSVKTLMVKKNRGYIIDGEIYDHGEETEVTLESGPEISIFSPGGESEVEI